MDFLLHPYERIDLTEKIWMYLLMRSRCSVNCVYFIDGTEGKPRDE